MLQVNINELERITGITRQNIRFYENTDALLVYANENNLNLTITKAGMYPEFEIDGVEYTASRRIGRFGAVVQCTMLN